MVFCFQLFPHTNALYRDAQKDLARAELTAILQSRGIPAAVAPEIIGGSDFLLFECEALPEDTVAAIARHSAFLMLWEKQGGLLRPITPALPPHIPYEIADYLKYKGKTNASFTRLLINLAASAAMPGRGRPLLLDPLCGKGTSLLCALSLGMDAAGIDLDAHDIKDCCDFFARYCEGKRYKLARRDSGFTCGKQSIPGTEFTVALSKEALKAGDSLRLRLFTADTGLAPSLLRRAPADLLAADLPYGVQHAPQSGGDAPRFERWLHKVLPAWHDALRPGGAAALAFNTHTIPRETLATLLTEAGFAVLTEPPYDNFRHFVETSVLRDVLVCTRP